MQHMFSDLPAFRRDMLGFLLARGSASAESLLRLNLGPRPVYLVTDADLVKPILKAEEEVIDKGRLIYKLREVIGNSSITMSGPEHRRRRAAVHSQITAGLASTYVPLMEATIRQAAVQAVKQGEVDAHHFSAMLALRIVCALLFGKDVLSSGDENALVEAVNLVQDDLAEGLFRVLPHTPWAYMRKKRKLREAHRILSLVVDRVREKAVGQSLMKAYEELGLTGDDLRDEVLLMLLAGHHTSGSAIAWLLYHIAVDHSLAEKLAAEARSLGDGVAELSHSRIKEASVSRSLAMEVLRLYPSTFWLSREVMKPTELAGVPLKPGTSLLISQWHLHRDPRYWESPAEFNIGRSFANKAYLPFGVGPRACVGMSIGLLEMQLVALEFASVFKLRVTSEVPALAPRPSVTLVPPPISIHFEPRGKIDTRQQAA